MLPTTRRGDIPAFTFCQLLKKRCSQNKIIFFCLISGVDLAHVSTTWALTCPEIVHQRLCMKREMETWLSSDSRVGNNSVIDHRR